MKTLEELGISPAPWRVSEYQTSDDIVSEIIDANNGHVAETLLLDYDTAHANNNMLGAAPDMYEALVALIDDIDYLGIAHKMTNAIIKANNALRKASGEKS